MKSQIAGTSNGKESNPINAAIAVKNPKLREGLVVFILLSSAIDASLNVGVDLPLKAALPLVSYCIGFPGVDAKSLRSRRRKAQLLTPKIVERPEKIFIHRFAKVSDFDSDVQTIDEFVLQVERKLPR